MDIGPYIAKRVFPVAQLAYEDPAQWHVRTKPFFGDAPLSECWSLVRRGDYIALELFPYRTLSVDPVDISGFLLDIGSRFIDDLPARPLRIHWAIGRPWIDRRPEANAFTIWLGLALQIK